MLIFKRHKGNFAKCLQEIANAEPKQTCASVSQLIDERMRQGVDVDICINGAWGSASFNEVSGRILATRAEFNPLLAYSNQAVEAMRTGEFYLTDKILLGDKTASQVLAEIAEQDKKSQFIEKEF